MFGLLGDFPAGVLIKTSSSINIFVKVLCNFLLLKASLFYSLFFYSYTISLENLQQYNGISYKRKYNL